MSAVMEVNEDAAPEAQEQEQQQQRRGSCNHPVAATFHLFFKILAIAVYLILWWKVGFVISFVVITFCLAFDFWTTKNVTGRLMVGLRWWNEVKEDGTSKWRFETLPDSEKWRLNQLEGMIFWGALLLSPIAWIICFITALLSVPPDVQWAVLDVIAVILNVVNLAGYIKCARGARQQVRRYVQKKATKAVIQQAVRSAEDA